MTNEEAIEHIENIPNDGLTMNEIEALQIAIEALEKQSITEKTSDKYRWHDLRKNPNDLPINENGYTTGYMVKEDIVEQPYSAYWDGNFWEDAEGFQLDGIIAWKEIEPFCAE